MSGCLPSPLPSVRVGDTWDGLVGAPVSVDPEFDDPLALVRMTFVKAGETSVSLTLSSAESSEITIDDAAAYAFTVLPRVLGLTAGFYSWAIELTDSAGRIQTPKGSTIEITADL